MLADFEPGTLAGAIIAALGDRGRLTEQRRRGRSYVEINHSPARLRTDLAAALGELASA